MSDGLIQNGGCIDGWCSECGNEIDGDGVEYKSIQLLCRKCAAIRFAELDVQLDAANERLEELEKSATAHEYRKGDCVWIPSHVVMTIAPTEKHLGSVGCFVKQEYSGPTTVRFHTTKEIMPRTGFASK